VHQLRWTGWIRSSSRTCVWRTSPRARRRHEPWFGDCRHSHVLLARHVLAVSFLEAPLKFRAPGVTLPIGLGIGRLVFRALNRAEAYLAAGILIGLAMGNSPVGVIVASAIVIVVLAAQMLVVRPRLARRSDAVLAGQIAPRSRAHYAYAALEVVKVIALAAGGILLLSS
jgi:hypothetical protein